MKPWIWLRSLAGVFAVFTAGHTMGVFRPPTGGAKTAVLETMRSVRFDVMGSDRSYMEFYRGFGLFVSLTFVVLAVVSLQAAAISRRNPRVALPLALTLEGACVGSAILSWMYFFAAPIVMSFAALACSTLALVGLARAARVSG